MKRVGQEASGPFETLSLREKKQTKKKNTVNLICISSNIERFTQIKQNKWF